MASGTDLVSGPHASSSVDEVTDDKIYIIRVQNRLTRNRLISGGLVIGIQQESSRWTRNFGPGAVTEPKASTSTEMTATTQLTRSGMLDSIGQDVAIFFETGCCDF